MPTYCGADVLPYLLESLIKSGSMPDMILFVVKACPISELEGIKVIEDFVEKT
ncbi:MAG: hypothetical protein QW701_04080 [Candidatus Nezhaarchaeales archaeon]